MISVRTFTYKVVGNCKIKADVYAASDDAVKPLILWIHGGALMFGRREDIRPEQIDLYRKAGYAIASIDYRLAPQTKLKAIIEDIQDAYKWMREEGPHLFNIDTDRMAVVGHSAGGYLTLMTGFCVDPRPKALVSFYGYGDIAGSWYSKPSPFYLNDPWYRKHPISKKKAYAITRKVISRSTGGKQCLFYIYCRQHGLWPKEVTGHDPDTEPRAFDPFCPVRNVTKKYPPTLLLHGDKDTDVPYEQSVMMENELSRVGVEHELITIPNGGHCFDWSLKDSVVADAYARVLVFLRKHLG